MKMIFENQKKEFKQIKETKSAKIEKLVLNEKDLKVVS